jgi:hypothetical protein
MIIKLIKEYTFGRNEKAKGTELEVTNALGAELISKKIATEVSKVITDVETILKKSKGKNTNKEENNVILQHNNQDKDSDTK